jgi:membrane-associated protein
MPHVDLANLIQTVGYVGLFVIIFAETGLLVGFFLPGDSLLFTAGFLASQGHLDIRILVPVCFVAAVTGDAVGYAFGRRVGRALFRRPESRLFKAEYLYQAETFFQCRGGKAVVLARFLPIVRTFVPIVAGVGMMQYRRFAVFNGMGAVLWAIGVPLAGSFLGSTIPGVDRYLLPIIALIIVVSAAPSAIHVWRENGDRLKAMAWQQRDRIPAQRRARLGVQQRSVGED